jgi:Flp pilus assembly protein TadG
MRRLNKKQRFLRFGRRQEGAVAVEFALILSVLMTLVVGGMDMAHMFYMEHVITNASREGARYATKYTYPPNDTSTSAIKTYIENTLGYNNLNLDNLNVQATTAISGVNKIVTVTVSADKNWWILGSILGNPKHLTGTTAMAVEVP